MPSNETHVVTGAFGFRENYKKGCSTQVLSADFNYSPERANPFGGENKTLSIQLWQA